MDPSYAVAVPVSDGGRGAWRPPAVPCKLRAATAVLKRLGEGGIGARLGNQLFLVATTLAFAQDQGRAAIFVASHSMRPYLQTVYGSLLGSFWRLSPDVELGEPWGSEELVDSGAGSVGPRLAGPVNASLGACVVALNGYFQDPRLFDHHRQAIGESLWHRPFAEDVARRWSRLVGGAGTGPAVAVHVRRGDFVRGGRWLGDAYFRRALVELQRRLGSPGMCVFFSDDPAFVTELAPKLCPESRRIIVDEPEDAALYLLASCCSALVISNSSFSWWAAYLAGARRWALPPLVVAPRYVGRHANACTWSEQECAARKDQCLEEWDVLRRHSFEWLVIEDFVPPSCPAKAPKPGDPACWLEGFSWDTCCLPEVWGDNGNADCFPVGSGFSFQRCCTNTSAHANDA